MPRPLSSPVAGSVEPPLASPLAKEAVVPPTVVREPVPVEGVVVPVAVLVSGVGELKFHCTTVVCACTPDRKAKLSNRARHMDKDRKRGFRNVFFMKEK